MGLGAFPKGSPEPQPRRDVGRIVGGLWVDLWGDCGLITLVRRTHSPRTAPRGRGGGAGALAPGGAGEVRG